MSEMLMPDLLGAGPRSASRRDWLQIALAGVRIISGREWFPARSATTLDQERLLSSTDLRPATGRFGVVTNEPWAQAVIARLEALIELVDDWDSYGSPRPTAPAITSAVYLLRDIVGAVPDVPVPVIQGTAEGGVTIEWFTADIEFVLEVDPSGTMATAFYRDRVSGYLSESPLAEQSDDVTKALHRLRLGY